MNTTAPTSPARLDCPAFCRSTHNERPDEVVVHEGEPLTIAGAPSLKGLTQPTIGATISWVQGDSRPYLLLTGDVLLDADATDRLVAGLAERAAALRDNAAAVTR